MHPLIERAGQTALALLSATLCPLAFAAEQAPPRATLVADGKVLLPVVVAKDAPERVRQAAQTLADYLGKIGGAKFNVIDGDGTTGLAVGLPRHFPALALKAPWDEQDITRREDYLLDSHAGGLWLLGASERAIEHAVWDLLYRLGYRQFFPGAAWECVPEARDLGLAVHAVEHPAYYARRIWYGFGAWDYAARPYEDWCARNRVASGIELSTGHAYDGIISRNKAEFEKHPEYLALVGGKRTGTKFCIANEGLRRLVVEDAMAQCGGAKDRQSLSVDPSDGGGWCECEACAKIGSVSDRAVTLANEVAAAVNTKHPGTLVGMYAYNYHSPPPALRVHPQVVISVATAFIKGGLTVDELIQGWAGQGATLGIREYYSVNTWDRDMPAQARGGNLAYLKRTIPDFHVKGARFLSAESSDNWGPNGLGYYLAARMLWDVREAERTDALVEDFLARAFGPAREPMREFYRQMDGSQPHLLVSDQIGRLFRSLEQARAADVAPAVRVRLDHLTLYARYVDLYHRYAQAKDAARQQAFEALIRHAYRMRTTMLVHTKALYRDLAGRDKSVSIPKEAAWNVAEGKNPWKSSAPFTPDELAAFLKEGVERHPLAKLDFKPVAYSEDLVGAAPLSMPESAPGRFGACRGRQTFFTRVENAPATIELAITGGLIEHYRNRGNVRVELWKLGGASQTGERETLVVQDRSVPPDGNEHAVKLEVKESGLYRLTLDDGNDRTLVKWNSKLPLAIRSTQDAPMNPNYSDLWQLCFYVPRGTKMLGFFGGEHGEVRDSTNRPVFWLNGREPNFYGVAVPEGEDGKVWHIRYGRGAIRLLTVPPYFARSAAELLLPAEVVQKDTQP